MVALQQATHLGPGPATELLWNTYHPFQLWYPFAGVGIASAVAIFFYARWVRQYEGADV